MPHARKIRLGRVREEVGAGGVREVEQFVQTRAIDTQVGNGERRVVDGRTLREGEFANAVDRVVVVKGEQETPARRKGITFADVFQRTAGVQCEDRGVVVGRIEVGEHRLSRALNKRRRGTGTQAGRMRVAESLLLKERRVRAKLRVGEQARAGVVQIDGVLRIESRVVEAAQLVQDLLVAGGVSEPDGASPGVLGRRPVAPLEGGEDLPRQDQGSRHRRRT